MNKFPELDQAGRDWHEQRVKDMTDLLLKDYQFNTEWLLKLLSSSNAGGATAILTYMAKSASGAEMPHAREILAVFVVGFFLTMILTVLSFYLSRQRLLQWSESARTFYKGELTWGALFGKLKASKKSVWFQHTLGWLSLACFVTGSLLSISDLLIHSPPLATQPSTNSSPSADKSAPKNIKEGSEPKLVGATPQKGAK